MNRNWPGIQVYRRIGDDLHTIYIYTNSFFSSRFSPYHVHANHYTSQYVHFAKMINVCANAQIEWVSIINWERRKKRHERLISNSQLQAVHVQIRRQFKFADSNQMKKKVSHFVWCRCCSLAIILGHLFNLCRIMGVSVGPISEQKNGFVLVILFWWSTVWPKRHWGEIELELPKVGGSGWMHGLETRATRAYTQAFVAKYFDFYSNYNLLIASTDYSNVGYII